MSAFQNHVDLSSFNTLGLPSSARFFARIRDVADLAILRQESCLRDVVWRVLGGGSNLWLPRQLDALVLKVEIPGMRLVQETPDAIHVAAGAGVIWQDFVAWTLANGWGGLENLSLIPGTVGAAPVQNVGAYGTEIRDYLHQLTAVHLHTGEVRRFSHAECAFAYRDSVFKHEEANRWLISEVEFCLPRSHQVNTAYGDIASELVNQQWDSSPQSVALAVSAIRQRKLPDPARIGNAGSFFHNPLVDAATRDNLIAQFPKLVSYPQADGRYKLAAGWLIEQVGWKGRSLGPAGMYDKQALVLVNHGGADGDDIDRLARQVQADVRERFGVVLIAEPVRW